MPRKSSEIIDEMNELLSEYDDLPETFIDVVLDARRDDGLPEPTALELSEIRKNCDAAANRANEIEEKLDDLRLEYMALTNRWPRYIDGAIPRFSDW